MEHHLYFLTLAAELDTPWVTFRIRPPTFPYFISPVTPSETSFRSPMGLPRKSTDPRIRAAWLRSSCHVEEGDKEKSTPVYTAVSQAQRLEISLVPHSHQHQQPPFHSHQLQSPPKLLPNAHIPEVAPNTHKFSLKIILKAIQKNKKGMKQESFFTGIYITMCSIFPFPLFPQIGN